ncbi:MAG: phosphate acyltransferase PlsX [Thioclava marina]|uniref:Phosphate acyltransferase n=2 Tax=Thioclava marina TaxID=1915077 RepID=A0ABX3MKX9_9RHOB|nr:MULTISPECIES: phosphate acyltransferase PlsX [Thioclava]TNE91411.1 MAG: phosphate acyltransferase PlsX [Paracoccaceae bacterium]MBC7144993.1 phosphate acyltransferase PlsX [Thioclava marina]MBD3802821.1 phosphate acyltransferase PlsX [Thioclava sp.]OOY12219.1 phosphate acyltransferase [Thioclava marina]OOY27571.1 phosphate acyltransferase [Thioclava sp. L04-15]
MQASPQGKAPAQAGALVISIDAMGGDLGPAATLGGIAKAARANPELRFIVHGPREQLEPLIAQHGLGERIDLRHAERVVTMEDKPAQVMRSGKDTSMWSAIESVRAREADVAVSCGNTGALMAVSMLRLRKIPGVNRPAIASFWPSRGPAGWNVMLDMGADVKADAEDLLTYALMGSSYARNALGLETPRVGLLNVGTEEHKGRAELKEAHELIRNAESAGGLKFVGFVEGNELAGDRADVIVTDGFTGNVALKTGEGTAKFVSSLMKEALTSTLLAKLGALLAMGALKKLQAKVDPRRANGGVFLGLNGTVVKSHGSADATGFAAAIELAARLAKSGFGAKLAARVASALPSGQDVATGADPAPENSESSQ